MQQRLQSAIGYRFNNEKLLTTALTHSSYANEHRGEGSTSYERLEFFGDSVLGFVVSEYLARDKRHFQEGELTRMRSRLVCEQSLATVAESLNLGEYILFGKGEEGSGGRRRRSVIADVVEAIIAAIFMDGGLKPAADFVHRFVLTDANVADAGHSGDFKTELQEIVQRDNTAELFYRIVEETGPDHDKRFVSEVVINGNPSGRGEGRSKKEAEQAAARMALDGIR